MFGSSYSTSSFERPSRDLFYSWFSYSMYWVRPVACILRVFFNVEAFLVFMKIAFYLK